jgi:HSP20 family protein
MPDAAQNAEDAAVRQSAIHKAIGYREVTTMKSLTLYDAFAPTVRDFYRADPFEILDRVFDSDNFFTAPFRSPAIDVREEEGRYLIEAELPGLSEKDLKLELKDRVLALSTAKKEEKEEKTVLKWLRHERREFSFARSFELPDDADGDKIEARFKDGLLVIELPKKPETAPRLVPVKVA